MLAGEPAEGAAVGRGVRGLRVTGVLAVLLLGAGICLAVLGHAAGSGPEGVVRGYYAALERADAPAALGYGTVPKGPRALLTSAVLAEQQRIAPMSGFEVRQTWRSGARAAVRVAYTLGFAGGAHRVGDTVRLRQRDGVWRLTRVAVRTQLSLTAAGQRAAILGARVPRGYVLLFPGAVPIRFDTPYLTLAPGAGSVAFHSPPSTPIRPVVSWRGRSAARDAVRGALQRCWHRPSAGTGCPQPAGRFVPGTLRGTLLEAPRLEIRLDASAVGVLDVTGRVRARLHYRKLTFRNREVPGVGTFAVPLHARGYAVAPLTLSWMRG
ncbi:MAG TPA: hypothetical protein VFH38_04000 [Jatrophihabitans sp.]|nr:hypothetical protein [Jatrophihabitans sp.]